MGHSISKAVQQKGKKPKNASWSGWIYIMKNGLLQTAWKRRFCRVANEKLYYFSGDSPSKGSKGWVSLADMIAMVHLPFRRDPDATTPQRVPFLMLMSSSSFLVAFESEAEKDAFSDHLSDAHRIPVMPIVTEDWSIVQLDTRKQPGQAFVRYFLVFVGSGDLLFFTDATAMELACRVRMLEMKNVLVVYDAAGGNGVVLSPRARAAAAAKVDGPTMDIVMEDRTIRLEFDALTQYEKWRDLLVDALAGDFTGTRFQQRQVIATRRKLYQRQQKMDDLKKKRKTKKGGGAYRHTLHEEWSRSDDNAYGGRATDVMSRTSSAVDASEWSAVSSEYAHEASDDMVSTTTKKKKKKKKERVAADESSDAATTDGGKGATKKKKKKAVARHDDTEWSHVEAIDMDATTNHHVPAAQPRDPPKANNAAHQVQVAPVAESSTTKKPPRVRVDLFASSPIAAQPSVAPPNAPSTDAFEAKRQSLLARLTDPLPPPPRPVLPPPLSTYEAKRQSLLARLGAAPPPASDYSSLSPKIQVPVSSLSFHSTNVLSMDSRPRRTSTTSKKEGMQVDLQKRHEMLRRDFMSLQATMGNGGQSKRLQRQIEACARAIDTLGALAMYPPPEEPSVPPILDLQRLQAQHGPLEVKGNWFTTEPRGGRRVRHWQRRVPT
ncbi:Aste57867_1721 [Aphanomyces stellatus]|uniref:Aste57867_1721 protein n=1 Tax=Aphanomyces stellatus TaxID=120398 RepID=A0A485K8I8_9STRA|nr:hypothetical protein As57867_001719 [Aphanomyces stellatus]VFT78932.1 Aste57867_1721 [Aphanomyces stellatus]